MRRATALAILTVGCGVQPGFPIVAGGGAAADAGTTMAAVGSDSTAAGSESSGPAGTTGAPQPILVFEAEASTISGEGEITDDPDASGMQFVAVPGSGGRHDGGMAFNVEIVRAASYDIWGRVLTESGGQDSFRLYVDDAEVRDPWNTGQHPDWTWVNAANVDLEAGSHLMEFRFREAGSRLDVIAIVDIGVEPDLPVP